MDKKIGIIGYGSMGKMILEKFIETKTIDQSKIFVSNRTYEKMIYLNEKYPQINICKDNIFLAKNTDIVFICVKPLEIKTVLIEIANVLNNNCHIITLTANVLIKQMEQICINRKISKIIPSITAEVNKSVTLICHNNNVGKVDKNTLKTLLECFGTVVETRELEIGGVSELTSCMPGFIGAIFKVITNEAEKYIKIGKQDIIKMVMETMYGTGKLLLENEMTYDELIERVATKGGITEEGTKIIEAKFPEIINEMFSKTLEKRKMVIEKAQNDFNV
jgi:pyrroline-5-carboxylate reductase